MARGDAALLDRSYRSGTQGGWWASPRACGALTRLPLPAIWLLTRLPLIVLAVVVGAQIDSTYLHYGQAMAAGGWPYRDFAVEYPPLSLAFLAVPALAAHGLARLSLPVTPCFSGWILLCSMC